MKEFCQGTILYKNNLTDTILEWLLIAPTVAKEAKPGQFINVYTQKGEYLLPRPISICEVNPEKGILRIVFQVVGKGTAFFSQLQKGDRVQIMGPLGNGFTMPKEEKGTYMLVGGGIGVPPLLETAKQLKGDLFVFIGSRTAPILTEEFKSIGAEVFIATDDGSLGFHGNVVDLIKKVEITPNMIYACGPKVMLKFLSKWAAEKSISAQVSMEERMACGIGACVGCAIKIYTAGKKDWQYQKVCKDGPVFYSNEVVWND